MSQPHSPLSSGVGSGGGGKGDVSGVEEDKGDKSAIDVVAAKTTATCTSSARSPTSPPEDLHMRKGGSRGRTASDTQQVWLTYLSLFYMILHLMQCRLQCK